jgi:hypothetical protein
MFSTSSKFSASDEAPATSRSRKSAKPRQRAASRDRINWRSRSTVSSLAKSERLQKLLAAMTQGLTVREIGVQLGMSRQLALYHVKKACAAGLIQMILEPCAINGGLQYRVWNPIQLARHCARWLPMAERVQAALQSAAA